METPSQASNTAFSGPLQAPALSTAQQLRDWWVHSGAEQAAALDGVPIGQLLNHCLQSFECGHPAAQQEMDFLLVLLERWLLRFEADIAAFPEAAVPVLQRQKAQLQATRSALTQMQQALQGLAGESGACMSPAVDEATAAIASAASPSGAWLRHRAPVLTWALRRRSASHPARG
ncbi:hypothetical protein [Paucibacter sp. Y2R2-4]|uniref:hypothetical protein n=1 Tax=Paucibacter sp. Y2R2-4 TaxID=2893553 RepID=UPI0021E397DD|nr:hypothetical protein [Paucibacter sp. Y2R2-4]MCV2348692.1 hypothetical protein [Paucibacter sp. Y2R2-4]